jgi:hypothetical protein
MAWTALDHAIAALKNPSTRQEDIPRLAREILTEYGFELAYGIDNIVKPDQETDEFDAGVIASADYVRRYTPKGA